MKRNIVLSVLLFFLSFLLMAQLVEEVVES